MGEDSKSFHYLKLWSGKMTCYQMADARQMEGSAI